MDNGFKQLANPEVAHCPDLAYALRDKTFLFLSHKSYVGRRMRSYCYFGNLQINKDIAQWEDSRSPLFSAGESFFHRIRLAWTQMDGNEGSAQALYEGNQTRTAFAGWCAV